MKKNGFPVKHLSAFSKFIGKVSAGSGKLLPIILAALSLTACMSAAIPASDQTSLPQASETSARTETPTAEATLTPTNTATPTATEIPPLELADFSADLKGKGVHGGMVCYSYAGDAKDLEGLTLLADISRDGKAIEKNISPEQIDGENCFEITDANYLSVSPNAEGGRLLIPEEPLSVKITAAQEGRVLSNNAQTIDLGKYVQFPFLQWIYPEGVKDVCIDNYHEMEGMKYIAWDLVPKPNEKYPTLVGTPILAPVDGIAFVQSNAKEGESVKHNLFSIYSIKTGYIINLTHNYELVPVEGKWVMISEYQGEEVIAGDQVGIVGPKDFLSGMPHTHLQILIPPERIDLSEDIPSLLEVIFGGFSVDGYKYIYKLNLDPIYDNLFLDSDIQSKLENKSITLTPCDYAWGEVVIPQQLPFTIDGEADDWADYTPVLTDKTGDSDTGSVMDLSELYMAKDDNYLYLMLKAGDKPSDEWASWAVDFVVDLFVQNVCGTSKLNLEVWTERIDYFTVDSADECEASKGPQEFPADYIWGGDGLEVRILLAYLKNPPDAKAIEAKGILLDSQNQLSFPDHMD